LRGPAAVSTRWRERCGGFEYTICGLEAINP
jgi:hypothetical protein